MLPIIRQHAQIAFRHLDPEAREDAVQEVITNALVAYVRLFQRGKADLAYPTVLARYGVAQVRDGRKVGNHQSVCDVLSSYAQQKKDFKVQRLDRYNKEENAWLEILVEDRHATPADVAVTRIDFAAWLRLLPARSRKIATVLATGETTGAVAKRFQVSASCISHLRRGLYASWQEFQGEQTAAVSAAQAAA